MHADEPDDAAAAVRALHAADPTAAALDIRVREAAAGRVVLSQPVPESMINGHGVVHGGALFLLADTAFAYCCSSLGRPSVTRSADIVFLAPGRAGTQLVATAVGRSSSGRTTICDVAIVDEAGTLLAEFRGQGTIV
jgi:acyl-CoA thioesterase